MLRIASKAALLRLLRGSGVSSAVARSPWRRRRLLILGFHGVSIDDEHVWDPLLFHSPETFRSRLEAIEAMGCTVLPLSEGLERLEEGTLPPGSVSITFDDGLYDFLARAHPLLSRFGMPATVYQSTYYSEHQLPVFNPWCRYLLWKGRDRTLSAESVTGTTETFDLADPDRRRLAGGRILEHAGALGLSAEEKDDLAKELSGLLGVDDRPIRAARILYLLDPDEIARLGDEGVDFQLHTHRHRTPVDRELFVREIEDNRASLAAAGRPDARHFAYPSGVHRPDFLPWLRETGVTSATTVEPGLATRASDPLLLPRHVDADDVSEVEFDAWLSGVRDLFPTAVRHAPVRPR